MDPKHSWEDPDAYDEQAKKLAGMFVENFKKYSDRGRTDYTQYGPRV